MNPFSHLGPVRSTWPPLAENTIPWSGLTTSLEQEHHYRPDVEGKIPDALRGTLYRNGPGLFDRGGDRKRMVLDGDGVVTSFRFDDAGVDFRARFVRTPKFVAEEAAGEFLFPTWSTLAPEWRDNLGATLPSQAGITVAHWAGRLFAFDEVQKAFALDPDTLDSLGETDLVPGEPKLRFQAHWKWAKQSREWVALNVEYGRLMIVEPVVFDESGQITSRTAVTLPRSVYMHDWFVTEKYFVFLLHPAFIGLGTYLKLLAGAGTFAEGVKWRPKEGNLIALVPRAGGPTIFFETEAMWMWHSANAYDVGDEVVLDFIGSSTGGGLGSADSEFFQVMSGDVPVPPPTSFLYRYRLGVKDRTCRRETLADGLNYEMPFLTPQERGVPHQTLFLARADRDQLFWSSLVRHEVETGKQTSFHFGPATFCCEPVYLPAADGTGYLATVVYEHASRRSSLAILRADALADGPIARARLHHSLPLSFHGCYAPA